MENGRGYKKKVNIKNRLIIYILLIQFFFLIIGGRLFYLQIIKYGFFQKLSLENRTRIVPEIAPRGLFFDRNGCLLVNNRPAYSIAIIPEDVKANDNIIPKLIELLETSEKEIKYKLKKSKRDDFYPVKLKNDVSQKVVTIIKENSQNYPGAILMVESRRDYIRGEFGAHFFGYLGKINDNELKKSEYSNYRQDDTIGKTGLEKKYEKFLRGKDGKRIIEVNAIGQQLGTNVIDDPVPGYNLILTIDKNLQEVAEKAMEGKTGAIVALDPRSGEILAMVSKPGFNPNLFAGQISSELWKELNDNPMHPLINRTIMGAYPPGSTFKILIAITALEEKVIDAEFTEECLGEFIYGNAKYKCWKKEGHGRINVTEALINSCNIFFYKLGLNAGIKKVEKYALMFGLGKATGIDLSQERNGLVPNPSWKKSATKLPWYPGDNILIGVGQGALLVTPVQMANMISLIVNGGVLWQPHLVREVVSVNNRIIYKIPRKEISKINISAKTLEIIRDALWKVVNRWGTGRRTRIPGLNILGKTGTAQMAAKQDYYDDIETNKIPEQIRPHAWFVTCAPMKDPKIAIAILIEHGGEGGQSSAPIAKLMYDEYLKEEKRDYSLDKIHNPGDIPKPKDESMINLTHEPFYLFDSSQINPIIKNIVLETRE